MKILVTGAAGFIGFHTCLKLVSQGHEVYGIDNINEYYDPNLKKIIQEPVDIEPRVLVPKVIREKKWKSLKSFI